MEIHTRLKNKANKLIIFVPGSGHNYKFWEPIFGKVSSDSKVDAILFDFSTNENHSLNLYQDYTDLKKIIEAEQENYTSIELIATSQGAVSSLLVLADQDVNLKISKIHFVDPADYPIENLNKPAEEASTWCVAEKYNSESKDTVLSNLELSKINKSLKVNLVGLTLTNYSENGYFFNDYKDRGKPMPNGVPRLNQIMVNEFYNTFPASNRGIFININDLPHGLDRDGDLEYNAERLVTLFNFLLTY